MIWAKLSGVTSTAAPLNMSWQEAGSMPPIFDTPLYVQPTAVLMAAVALELGVPLWAKAIVAVNSANVHRGVNFFIVYFLQMGLDEAAFRREEPQLTSHGWGFRGYRWSTTIP